MIRARSMVNVALSLLLIALLVSSAQAQQQRRGFGGPRGGSMLGLLRLDQVQTEINLTDEQKSKVNAVAEDIMEGMRDQFAQLRDIEDRAQRNEKRNELDKQVDSKAREQLRDVLEGEQVMRFFQIYMQVRPAMDILAIEQIASRLEVTEEQKQKLAEVKKETEAQQDKLYAEMRDASQEQRRELSPKLRQLRTDANEKAVGVLTEDQKKTFDEMKGEKFELQMRRGRRQAT